MNSILRIARYATLGVAASASLAFAQQKTTPAKSPAPAQAPGPVDRTVIPVAGKMPELKMPTWTSTTLSNGAKLIVSERHALPLVSFDITFIGGSYQFEPADKVGLAGYVSGMMSEGTATRSGDDLANALQELGTNISSGIGGESGSLGFTSLKDKFAPALAILADEMMHPTYPQEAIERTRARQLVALVQAKDQTPTVAGNIFSHVVYGDHPYGRVVTEQTVKAITRADIVAFHDAYYQPGSAVITVVGDITLAQAKAAIDKAFAGWKTGGAPATFTYPAVPAPKPTTIYIVDKPGAAQSSFAIGMAGPPRSTPDYYALRVMNSMLGELFQSRLNADIREQKGYSYGVSSRFAYGRGPGAFRAGGDIRTNATDSALIEFVAQLKGIRGDKPPTGAEMDAAKSALIASLPGRVGSVAGVSGMISDLAVQGLPTDYYQQFSKAVAAVTPADVMRVAKQYIDPDHLAIVIVGDRKAIEASVRATNIAPVVILDADGKVVQ